MVNCNVTKRGIAETGEVYRRFIEISGLIAKRNSKGEEELGYCAGFENQRHPIGHPV